MSTNNRAPDPSTGVTEDILIRYNLLNYLNSDFTMMNLRFTYKRKMYPRLIDYSNWRKKKT